MPPEQRRLIGHDRGSRLDALNDERADHERHHRGGGNAERQHRNERGLGASIIRRLWRGYAFDRALAELLRCFRKLFLHRVRGERSQHGAIAGQNAERRTDERAAQDRPYHAPEVFARGHEAGDAANEAGAGRLVFEVTGDLTKAEHAHGRHHEADAVGEFRDTEGEALCARVDVGADQSEQQPEQDHADRAQQRAVGQHDRRHESEHHERKILMRSELECQLGERRRKGGQQKRGNGARHERADGGGGQRHAGAALFGHGVPVETWLRPM